MTRRPYYFLWLGPGRPPISVSNAGYGQPLRFDRQMADRREQQERARRPRLASEMPGWVGSEPPLDVLTEDDSWDRWPA